MFESVESSVVSIHAVKLILIRPDPCGSWDSVGNHLGSSSDNWDIWEGIIEGFSSREGLILEEIVGSSILTPVTGLSWFGRETHGLVISHGITPGFGGDGVLSSSFTPVEIEAVWHLITILESTLEKDLVNGRVSSISESVLKVGSGSSPEGAEVLFNSSVCPVCAGSIESFSGWINLFNAFSNWVSSIVSGNPLFIGFSLEEFPDLSLSGDHARVGAYWAVVDWHTSGEGLIEELVVPASLEDKDDDHDVKDGKSDEDETKNLSTSESGDETSMAGFSASEGNSGVGIDSDSHANVTGNDGGR